jgi:hypothetical protein
VLPKPTGGGTIIRAVERRPGRLQRWFADPDGHLWKLAAGPAAH